MRRLKFIVTCPQKDCEDIELCQGFVVRPGHENLVAMTAVNTIADPAIR